jgi:hypothetical protein
MEQATEAAKLKEEEESVKAPPGFQRNTAVEENERRGSHPVGPGFPIDTKADPIEFPRSQSPPNTLPTSNSQSLQASQAEGGKGIPLSATTKEEADENTPSPQSAVKNPERKSGGEPPKSSEAIATSAEGSMPQQSAYSTAEQNQLSSVEPLAEKPEPMALSKNTRGKIQPAPGRELATAPASRKKMPWSIYWQGLVHWAGKATSLDEEKGLKVEPIKSTTQGKEITPRKFNIGGKGTTQGKGTTPLKSRKSSIAGKGATQGQGSDGRGREDGMGRKIAETLLQPMGLWVKTRNLIDNEALPNGIPRITSFIASDSDGLTSIYRRFDKLNVRNLLLLEAKLAALEALQEKLDKEDVKNFQGDLQYNFTMSSTHSSFEWFALLGEGRDVINQDELDSSGRGIALKKAAPCKVRGKDGMVNIHGAGNYVNVSYSGREGKSGIPAFAFREWEKTRKKASENFAENVDDEIAELPEPRREALKEVVLEEDRPYWQNRWEVAQAIQHALKEYRKRPELKLCMPRAYMHRGSSCFA